MKCYLCVYRQPLINDGVLRRSLARNRRSPKLKVDRFLSRYQGALDASRNTGGRFYDWGDDPGFFAAEEFLGDVRRASWGICRPDVRGKLFKGDFVVFFCAQQQSRKPSQWNYYYIGVGTVRRVVRNRKRIWTVDAYRKYKRFYNLLIDSLGAHREVLNPPHSDWKKRSRSPYILFEGSKRTYFNVRNPLLVASYDTKEGGEGIGVLESWKLDDENVRALDDLIPCRRGGRKLRTSNPVYPHQPINLGRGKGPEELRRLRRRLVKISKASMNNR